MVSRFLFIFLLFIVYPFTQPNLSNTDIEGTEQSVRIREVSADKKWYMPQITNLYEFASWCRDLEFVVRVREGLHYRPFLEEMYENFLGTLLGNCPC